MLKKVIIINIFSLKQILILFYLLVLEKSHKDLQRQIVSLSKLTINFDEEIDKTQSIISDLFGKLRNLLNEREIQLKNELERIKTQGSMLFII
jgi:uncharacterized protein (DUF342 family)